MSEVVMNIAVAPAIKTFLWAFVFVVIAPVLITAGSAYLTNRAMMFSVTGIVTALSVALFAGGVLLLSRGEISLDTETLRVNAGFYERRIGVSGIDWHDSRFIDLAREPDLSPRLRLNGIGLPGYRAGWFRLANGTRAFLLTTHGPLAYLKVRDGEDLMLSVSESSPLAQKIHAAHNGDERR
ncbi:MAG: PH domain-containing protein [Gammaproteobacteria bacterium]